MSFFARLKKCSLLLFISYIKRPGSNNDTCSVPVYFSPTYIVKKCINLNGNQDIPRSFVNAPLLGLRLKFFTVIIY